VLLTIKVTQTENGISLAVVKEAWMSGIAYVMTTMGLCVNSQIYYGLWGDCSVYQHFTELTWLCVCVD